MVNKLIAIVVLALFCAAVWAQGEPVAQTDQTSIRLPVQKVLQIRPLTAAEDAAVAAYIQQYKAGLTSQNYVALGNALRLLIGVDQTHVPLTRTPAQYMADYQTFTQLLGRTDWYVNLPIQQPPAPQIVERPVVQTITVPQIITVPVPIPARQFIQPAGVTSIWTPAMPVATGSTVVGPWQDLVTATVVYRPEPKSPPCKPGPPDETCDPGGPQPPPAPNSPEVNNPGDPSGQIPCPPETDPYQPPGQDDHDAIHGPGGADSPTVADPVLPGE